MMNKTKKQIVQGSPKEIAEGVFDNLIVPMHSQMAKVSERDAGEFAFCIAGISAAGFLASSDDLDNAKELLLSYIECIYKDIQNEKKGVGILAKPMGKPA